MTDLQEITTETFDERVLGSSLPVLVDFSAKWCGPCKAAVPLLRDIKAEYEGEAEVVAVDIDREPELSKRYGIRGVPTFLLFKDGELIETKIGASSRSDFCAMIDRSLESAA